MPTKAGIFLTTTAEDYTNGPDGSTNYYGVSTDDTKLPMSYACPKAAEGMSAWTSWEEFHYRFTSVYLPQGIGMLPWVLPKGRSAQTAYEEGKIAAVMASAVQGLILIDLEDGHQDPPYWTGGDAEVDAWERGALDNGLREAWIVPDSRADKLDGERFWRWWAMGLTTRVLPQAYASIFYPPQPNRQQKGIDVCTIPLLRGGIAASDIYPVLSGTDINGNNPISGAELVEGIEYCKAQGFGGVFFWRRGLITQEQADAMLELDDPWANEPAPEPPPVDPPPVPSEWQRALARLNAASIEQRSATEEVIRLAPPG